MPGFLLSTDGDEHAQVRRLVSGAFTTRRVEAFRPYGGGIHFCLGAALARVELQESLPRLAAALCDPRAGGTAEWLPPTEAVYGPTHLPMTYHAT